MQQIIILTPLYNDEESFNIFAAKIESLTLGENYALSLLIINDGTTNLQLKTNIPYSIIHLHRNIGHQKAIAIGLAYAHNNLSFDKIIVTDCDGEDNPEDIIALLKLSEKSEIVVAKRGTRNEGWSFKLFYNLYKTIFLILTGKQISFGNFMLLSKKAAGTIVYYSEVWNHLAGTIIKSKLEYSYIRAHRGQRYAGKSKMNFSSLLLHGLGAVGVFIEIIAGRLLVFSMLMIALSIIAMLVILSIKLFTANAIPGWATTTLSSMLIVLLQGFLLSLFTIFLYLSMQSQRKFIPALHYNDYVRAIEKGENA
jgi:polyisoprenyl-phosphate glycosyltransferase